jgi:hypothetical protein
MKYTLRAIAFLGLLGFVFSFLGCSSATGTSIDSSSNSSAEMATPSGWTRQNDYPIGAGISADFVLFGPKVQNFTPNIIAITSPQSGASISVALQYEIDNLRSLSTVSNVVVDSSGIISFHGQEAALLQARYTMSGFDLLVREILFVYGGKDYQFVLTRLQSDEATAAVFSSAEQSLVLP